MSWTCLAEVCEEAAVDAAARHGRHAVVLQQRHLWYGAKWGGQGTKRPSIPTRVRSRTDSCVPANAQILEGATPEACGEEAGSGHTRGSGIDTCEQTTSPHPPPSTAASTGCVCYLLRGQAVDRVAEPAAAVLVGPPRIHAPVPPHGTGEAEAAGDGGDGDAGEGDHSAGRVQGGGGAVAETPERPLRHMR